MPITCTITFDNNPKKVYFSGSTVHGTVHLNLTEETAVYCVFIKISGSAHCSWTSGEYSTNVVGEENYLEERKYLILPNADGNARMAAGAHTHSFQCLLPSTLPTSVEADDGHIRYSACVVFDEPMKSNAEFTETFTVVKPLDLNTLPILREPRVQVASSVFYPCCLCCCCETDPLEFTVTMPLGGYTPGQTINLNIDTRNDSNQDVDNYSAQLIKQIVWHGKPDFTRKKEILVSENQTQVGCVSLLSQSCQVELNVPPTPPTDETTSSVCEVRYFIRVEAWVGICHLNPSLEISVTIGSIPLLESLQMSTTAGAVSSNNFVITSQPGATSSSASATDPLLPPGQISPLPYSLADIANAISIPQQHVRSETIIPTAPNLNDLPPTYEEAMSVRNVAARTVRRLNSKVFARVPSNSSGS